MYPCLDWYGQEEQCVLVYPCRGVDSGVISVVYPGQEECTLGIARVQVPESGVDSGAERLGVPEFGVDVGAARFRCTRVKYGQRSSQVCCTLVKSGQWSSDCSDSRAGC